LRKLLKIGNDSEEKRVMDHIQLGEEGASHQKAESRETCAEETERQRIWRFGKKCVKVLVLGTYSAA